MVLHHRSGAEQVLFAVLLGRGASSLAQPDDHPWSATYIGDSIGSQQPDQQLYSTQPQILHEPIIWQLGTDSNQARERLQKPVHPHSPVEHNAVGTAHSLFRL